MKSNSSVEYLHLVVFRNKYTDNQKFRAEYNHYLRKWRKNMIKIRDTKKDMPKRVKELKKVDG